MGLGGYIVTTEDIARVQDINDAYSTVVNMDYFPVTINQLPIVNGQRLTAPQFLEYIRKNMNSFVDTDLSEFIPYNAFGVNDFNLWNSNNPLNSVIGIEIASYMGFYDNGSVIVSKHSSTGWTFTTIHDPKYGDHPVSGNRDFGYVQNTDGSYTFYTRGVDRLTNFAGAALQSLKDVPFSNADQLWRSFQVGIVSYVRQNGGTALWETLPTTEEIRRPDWQQIKDVIDGKKPLSTLSSDCED